MAMHNYKQYPKGTKLLLIFKNGEKKVIKFHGTKKKGGTFVVVDNEGNCYRVDKISSAVRYRPTDPEAIDLF